MTPLELSGKRFERLLVLSRAENKYERPAWLCRCNCGVEKIIGANSLLTGHTKSCGCLSRERTCSRKNLTGLSFGRLFVLRGAEKTKRGRTTWLCQCACGIKKIVQTDRLLTGNTKSCGCLNLRRGAESPHWKGGITPPYLRIRLSPEYKNWRRAVFTRDNYTCQECGTRGGDLQAHHIKSFSGYPELRLELSNGQTLCPPCHKKTPNYLNTRQNKLANENRK